MRWQQATERPLRPITAQQATAGPGHYHGRGASPEAAAARTPRGGGRARGGDAVVSIFDMYIYIKTNAVVFNFYTCCIRHPIIFVMT